MAQPGPVAPIIRRNHPHRFPGRRVIAQLRRAHAPPPPVWQPPHPITPNWQVPPFADILRWNQTQNLQVILPNVAKYFNFNDFVAARGVSKGWNKQILTDKKFQKLFKGKLNGESWYRLAPAINLEDTFHWTELQLVHFKFHRNSTLFKNFWHISCSQTLSTLILSNCSFECDAFIFMLDRCSLLTRLDIHSTKLRDLSDLHTTTPDSVRISTASPCDYPTPSRRTPIQHLTFDSVYQLEQCFADYLLQRTAGQLKTLKIIKCFVLSLLQGKTEPKWNQMYREFQRNMFAFLQTNAESLTQFCFDESGFQMWFFANLALKPAALLHVQELYISLSPAEAKCGYDPFIQFMRLPHPTVQKLTLQFGGYVSSDTLTEALSTFKPTLREFRLLFSGNALAVSKEGLDISGALDGFEQLESLLVRDMKKICSKDFYLIELGRKKQERGVRGMPRGPLRHDRELHFLAAMQRLNSNLSSTFLSSIPRSVRKLSVEQCVFPEKKFNLSFPLTVELSPDVMVAALTNIQIRGPLLHSLKGIVKILIRYTPNVETLALPSCGLTDMEVTGFTSQLDIHRRHGFGLALLQNTGRIAEEVRRGIETEVGQEERESLMKLRKLKYLNLTNNFTSDVAFFDAFRNPGLKTLEIATNHRITDTGLEFLSIFCPALEQLNVKHCRKVTEQGLAHLVKRSQIIRRIYTTKEVVTRAAGQLVYSVSPNFRDVVHLKAESVNLAPGDQDLPIFTLY